MSEPFAHVRPGQDSTHPPASDWNGAMDAAAAHVFGTQPETTRRPIVRDHRVVDIRNDTGGTLERFAWVDLLAPIDSGVASTARAVEASIGQLPGFRATTLGQGRLMAVVQEKVAPGRIGRAICTGPAVVELASTPGIAFNGEIGFELKEPPLDTLPTLRGRFHTVPVLGQPWRSDGRDFAVADLTPRQRVKMAQLNDDGDTAFEINPTGPDFDAPAQFDNGSGTGYRLRVHSSQVLAGAVGPRPAGGCIGLVTEHIDGSWLFVPLLMPSVGPPELGMVDQLDVDGFAMYDLLRMA